MEAYIASLIGFAAAKSSALAIALARRPRVQGAVAAISSLSSGAGYKYALRSLSVLTFMRA